MANAPDAVKRLVDHFDQDRKVFLSADYKEEQLRAASGPSPSIRHSHFIIRTFLGMPVIHEESIRITGAESRVRPEAPRRPTKLLTCASVEAY